MNKMEDKKKPLIGITWRANKFYYDDYKRVIEEAGGTPVFLDIVRSKAVHYDSTGQVIQEELEESGTLKQPYADKIKAKIYEDTNISEVLKGIDGVFMTGGEDISPTLFKVPEKDANGGEKIDAARDVSDFMIMAYCMDKDIPIISVCRGMQMMGVVAGAGYIQELRDYYKSQGSEYTVDVHRSIGGTPTDRFVRHDVELIGRNTHLFEIVQASTMRSISSWHHQAVGSLEGTELIQSARTIYNGVEITEVIEHPKKKYCIGTQFHPENDVKIVLCDKKATPADYKVALKFFQELVKYASL